MAKTEKKKKKKKIKRIWRHWQDEWYVQAYRLACKGLSIAEIAARMDMPEDSLKQWIKNKPVLKWAIELAREEESADNILDHVYGRLPKKYRALYESITDYERTTNGYERVRGMLAGEGRTVKQHLFLFAIVKSNFSVSKALKIICVPRKEYQEWLLDPDFQGMMENIQQEMKDFFESALIKAVRKGDTQAIIFANRTKNRDRGYGDKIEVEHTGRIEHQHLIQVDIEKLSIKAQKEVYAQLEEREREQQELEELHIADGQALLAKKG